VACLWKAAHRRTLGSVSAVEQRDAAAVLALVREGFTNEGPEPFPPAVLQGLARLIPADAYAGYQEAYVAGAFRIVEAVETVGAPPSASIVAAYRALGCANPLYCGYHARETRVLRLSDFGSPQRLRRLPYYTEVWRPLGIEDALRLWLPAAPGRAITVFLERSGPTFSDREKSLLELARPHLVAMRAVRGRVGLVAATLGLTVRETQILGQVRRGLTNREIARALSISPHTVRKHLEHAFAKLGARSRTAALARLDAAVSVGRSNGTSRSDGRRSGGGSGGLTAREAEILGYVRRGLTNREIAGSLGVSPHTVRTHLEHIFDKLGVRTRTAALAAVDMPPAGFEPALPP
jgi:DNA-binding CsgD family transcriptional regulator